PRVVHPGRAQLARHHCAPHLLEILLGHGAPSTRTTVLLTQYTYRLLRLLSASLEQAKRRVGCQPLPRSPRWEQEPCQRARPAHRGPAEPPIVRIRTKFVRRRTRACTCGARG